MIQRFVRSFDNPGALLALVVTALLSLGLIMVYSASGARAGLEANRTDQTEQVAEEDFRAHHGADYFLRQVMWAGIGLALGFALLKVPIEWLEKYSHFILGACLLALLVVSFTPLGVTVNGARRWLGIGGFTIQPSEFAKIGLTIFMAWWLSSRREEIHRFVRGFLPNVGILALFCVLFMLEKDLGTIILVGLIALGMWALGQVRFRYLATMMIAALPVLIYLVFQHRYRLMRILAFMNPEEYATTYGYQLNQSLVAVGSGGLFGSGLGLGLQKYHFLSESHTDFIFAIVCEELGLIGAISICLLFALYVLIGFRISYKAPDYFSGLLAAGLTLMVGCAAFVNFFVVLGLAPTKGLPLPFFSYGGSSLLASLAATALLINISNYSLSMRGSREVM